MFTGGYIRECFFEGHEYFRRLREALRKGDKSFFPKALGFGYIGAEVRKSVRPWGKGHGSLSQRKIEGDSF